MFQKKRATAPTKLDVSTLTSESLTVEEDVVTMSSVGPVPASCWSEGAGLALGDDALDFDAVLAHPLVDGHAMDTELHGRLGD